MIRNAFETSICGTVMTAVCGIALLALIGCGESVHRGPESVAASGGHDKALKEILVILDDCNAALASITDGASAAAARPKIDDAVRRIQQAGANLETLGESSEADKKRMEAEYRGALDKRMATFMTEAERVKRTAGVALLPAGGGTKSKTFTGRKRGQSLTDKYKRVLKALDKKIKAKLKPRVRCPSTGGIRG